MGHTFSIGSAVALTSTHSALLLTPDAATLPHLPRRQLDQRSPIRKTERLTYPQFIQMRR